MTWHFPREYYRRKVMQELKWMPLDLQIFAEGDQDDTPSSTEETEQVLPKNEGRKFTQEDLNKINIKGKQDELKRILKATGFESEEALLNHLTKVKDYDEKVGKIQEYEAKELKETYLAEIRKNNASDEYVETIYLSVQPTENEKTEDYNKRIAQYLDGHKAFLKVNTSNKFFDSNYGYTGNAHTDSNNLSLGEALKLKMKK